MLTTSAQEALDGMRLDRHPVDIFRSLERVVTGWYATADKSPPLSDLQKLQGLRKKAIEDGKALIPKSLLKRVCARLEIDHDDSHAARPSMRHQDFALLVHGTQPKGSEAADALKLLKKNKVRHSYSRKAVGV